MERAETGTRSIPEKKVNQYREAIGEWNARVLKTCITKNPRCGGGRLLRLREILPIMLERRPPTKDRGGGTAKGGK